MLLNALAVVPLDAVLQPPKSGLHAVNDSRRKLIWPLRYGGVCDAYAFGGQLYRAAEESDRFSFFHADNLS